MKPKTKVIINDDKTYTIEFEGVGRYEAEMMRENFSKAISHSGYKEKVNVFDLSSVAKQRRKEGSL